MSVYPDPDQVKEDLREFVRAWTHFDKVTSRAIICGDFNKADCVDREGWEQLLCHTATCDVAPDLTTHVTARSTSNLDRCLISEDWISSAQWNPLLKATHALNFGHKIVQMQLRVRPTVLNNPRHRKHDTIPASVFMPGKDGNPAQAGTEALQGLIRLLHRTRARFLGSQSRRLFPSLRAMGSVPSVVPSRSAGEELSSSSRAHVYELTLQRHHLARQIGDLPRDDTPGGVTPLVDAHFHFSSCFWAW